MSAHNRQRKTIKLAARGLMRGIRIVWFSLTDASRRFTAHRKSFQKTLVFEPEPIGLVRIRKHGKRRMKQIAAGTRRAPTSEFDIANTAQTAKVRRKVDLS